MLKLVETKYQNVQTINTQTYGNYKCLYHVYIIIKKDFIDSMKPLLVLSGEYRIRTGGLLHAMQAL